MGRRTLGEARDGLGDTRGVVDESRDPRGGPGRVVGTSRRSGTGRLTLEEVCDGSGDPR